jgi:outer membrane cobalamin receptor
VPKLCFYGVVYTLLAIWGYSKEPNDSLYLKGTSVLDSVVVHSDFFKVDFLKPQSVTTINSEEWVGSAMSLGDLLGTQAGVQTRRTGGVGSFQTVSLRGISGKEVLVLRDGIPLNSAMGGAVDLAAITLEGVAEVQIYKGVVPLELGGNALGGAINIKSNKEAVPNRIKSSMGAFGLKTFGGEWYQQKEAKYRWFASLNITDTRNDWEFLDRNKTPYNLDDDYVRKMENHQYHAYDFVFNPVLQISKNQKLTTGFWLRRSHAGLPAFEGATNRTAYHEQNIFSMHAQFHNLENNHNKIFSWVPFLSYQQWNDHTFWSSLDENMGATHGGLSGNRAWGHATSKTHSLFGSLQAKLIQTTYAQLSVNAQGRHSQIATETKFTGFPFGDWPGSSQEATLALESDFMVPSGSIVWGSKIGGSLSAIRNATRGGKNPIMVESVPPSDTLLHTWGAHGGIHALIGQHWNVFSNVARYTSTPTLREKFGSNGAFKPNPDLQEEIVYTLELGTKFSSSKFYGQMIGFRTILHNGIILLSDGNMSKPVNMARATIEGLESSLEYRWASTFKTEVRITWQNALNSSRLYTYYGNQLPHEPEWSGVFKMVAGPFWGARLTYWADYKSLLYLDQANTQRIPADINLNGSLLHNVLLQIYPWRGLTINATIANFSERTLRYEDLAYTMLSSYSRTVVPMNEWRVSIDYAF